MVNCNVNNEYFILRRKKIYIEIPVFLIYFAFTFADSITSNLIKHRTCYVILGFKEAECALLGTNSSSKALSVLDRKVQPSAIVITSTLSIIQSLIPPLLCFFIGSWCNQYGRKPIMLYSTFAFIIQYSVMIFISAVPHMSPWYILLSQILVCASGGIPAFVTVIFSYLVDTLPEHDRSIRISVLEAVRSCGILLGIATGATALHSTGYVTVYLLSVIILVAAWILIFFYVPESIQITHTENKLQSFFDFSSLLSTTKIAFKPRENYKRLLILTIISIVICYITATTGSNSVLSMYLQNRFHWNTYNINNYGIVINVTTIIGGLICVYVLHIKLNCSELIAILAGLLSMLSGAFVLAIATTTSIIHLGGCIQCFGPAILSMAKAYTSKIIPHKEISSLFAVIAAIETVFTLVGVSFFAVIINTTLTSNPATFLFVAIGLYCFQLIFVSILLFIQKYWNPLTFIPIEDGGD